MLLQAENCQVAQLTSAMIPQPATAFARAPPAPETERCGSANLMVCRKAACLAYPLKGASFSGRPCFECCWKYPMGLVNPMLLRIL